jgi:hypothetical protein
MNQSAFAHAGNKFLLQMLKSLTHSCFFQADKGTAALCGMEVNNKKIKC